MNLLRLLEHGALALGIGFVIAVALAWSRVVAALPVLLTLLAAGSAIVLIALVVNHLRFPLDLEVMEGVVLQHARRAMHGQSIYPLPSPDYVPLAYNALFYLLAAPFLLLFGDTLATLRLLSVIGFAGSAAAIFALVRANTRSAWWAALATGLFTAAYAAMDSHLDTAHADSWLLCCALWGTYLIARETRASRIAGVLVLVAAFWFKQHGAIFLAAGVLALTWRDGWRSSVPYWLIAIGLGPVLYLLAPRAVLGPAYHYFTWTVPSGWSQFTVTTIPRVVGYLVAYYPVLALAAVAAAIRDLRAHRLSILNVQLGAALVTACMGALDIGSSYNVFIPVGAFCIVCGTIELARVRATSWRGVRLGYVGMLLAFATLLHDPRTLWVPASANASFAALQKTIRELPGRVYAPTIGQLPDGPELYPAAHWVALDDMMRGRHRTAADSAQARHMLDPLRHPATTMFILTNGPLETAAAPVRELAPGYVLVQDFGDRFAPLSALPGRFETGWPRYLYRSVGSGEPRDVR